MNLLNPLFAATLLLICYITANVILRFYTVEYNKSRFTTIDGLRGFLAVFVFIHHSVIWYKYLESGIWTLPKSNLYIHLGQTAVTFFFMISSFLFANKLIEFKGSEYDWKSFFTKRFFRLGPLHFFGILLIVIIVGIQSEWVLYSSAGELVIEILRWLGFAILDVTDINSFERTYIINAAVLWSLPYEWLLYFMLPIVSIFFIRGKIPYLYILVGILFVIIAFQFRTFSPYHLLSFASGGFAALVKKYLPKNININQPIYTVIAIASLLGILFFSTSNNILCKIITTIFFTIVALGNNLFGILKSKSLNFLGEVSYSTYLLHGIILYVILNMLLGKDYINSLELYQYFTIICLIAPLVVLISFITYYFIEKPAIKFGREYAKRKSKKRNQNQLI